MSKIRARPHSTPHPRAPRPRAAAAVAPPAPGAEGRAILAVLAVLLVIRAALAFTPGMWAWSLNLQRFVAPWIGWALWGLAALALVPALSVRVVPHLARAGDAIERHPRRAGWVAALASAAVVSLLPDRVRFVGDFLLRQGTTETLEKPAMMFPQALPLDLLLHYHVPSYLASSALITVNGAARVIGALEAGALGALAVAFARSLSLRGLPAVGVVAVVVMGGYLGMFTGFSKAFAELVLLVMCVAVYGLRVVRHGRGLLPLGIALALGVGLHRSALGLLPAVALAWAVWAVRHARDGAWRRAANLIGLLIPIATLAVMIPRIAAVVARWDKVHFAPPGSEAMGGPLGILLSGARPADLANLLVMLSPLVVMAPLLAWAGRYQPRPRAEFLFLIALAGPFLAVMPFIHPVQGLFRDWDDFAATGVALSLVVAWLAARALSNPAAVATAAALIAAAASPTLLWLAHHSDLERGLARVRALMTELPIREPSERGNTWDYLGIQNANLQRWDQAAEDFARAAETSPSPRIKQERAMAETMRGNYRLAQQIYRDLVVQVPENPYAWLGLATTSMPLNDFAQARRGAQGVLDLDPGNSIARGILEEIARREGTPPGSAPP